MNNLLQNDIIFSIALVITSSVSGVVGLTLGLIFIHKWRSIKLFLHSVWRLEENV